MPRRSVVLDDDDDDAVPLSDLLRTGEASRLRRRGAMRATAHRRDDEEDSSALPLPHGNQGGEQYLELACGLSSGVCSFTPAGPSRPSPLPGSSSFKKASVVGIVFSSTGCGAIVSTNALPGRIAAKYVYTSTEPVSSDVVHLHHKYLEPEQRALAETMMRNSTMSQGGWEAVGCRICGNALGLLYIVSDPRDGGNTSTTYIFFPSAVTPSPDFTFPPTPHPLPDDISIDSPTLSPRVTRYFRPDDELWPSEMNPSWIPDRGFTPTPPRSPPTAPTPLAYTAWQGVLNPPLSVAPTQMPASRTAADAPRSREVTYTAPVREPFNDWQTIFRSVSPRRTEHPAPPPLHHTTDTTHSEDSPSQPPSDAGTTQPHEHRDRAHLERSNTWQTSARPFEPPSLHRVARRPMPSMTRRPTSLIDWTSRGRHSSASDSNSWGVQGSDERFSRRAPSSRRITMPIPAPAPPPPPAPTFTLLDASGERSYPPSARSSLDVRDTLGVSMEVETEEAAIAHWLMQEHESESSAERSWTHHPDEENEDVGGDDSEEKDDDLDERRTERTSRNDIARTESHSGSLRGLVSR